MSDLALYLVPAAICIVTGWIIQASTDDTEDMGKAVACFGLFPGVNILFAGMILGIVAIGLMAMIVCMPSILKSK